MKDADFSRLMPLITAHLKDSPPPSPTPLATDDPDATYPPGDFLTAGILKQNDLLPWLDALQIVHAKLGSDVDVAARQAARRRFVFNETLLLSLMMLHHRADLQSVDAERARQPVVCRNLVRPLPACPPLAALAWDALHLPSCDRCIAHLAFSKATCTCACCPLPEATSKVRCSTHTAATILLAGILQRFVISA